MPDLRCLLSTQESIERFELAVVYVHPDTLAEQVFEGSVCAKTAQGSLALALLCFEYGNGHRLRCEARELDAGSRLSLPTLSFGAAIGGAESLPNSIKWRAYVGSTDGFGQHATIFG